MKKITIVTVNYNTEKDTELFLESVKKLKIANFSFETIVVDNGSTHKFTLPEKSNHVSLIRLMQNTGFTGGYNVGIKTALKNGADAVLIVNNDTLLDPDLLINLEKTLYSKETIGLTVPKIYFAKGHEFHKNRYTKDELGRVFWYAGGTMDWNNVQSIHRGVDEVDHGQYDTIEPTDFASGCCMLIKREVFEDIGMFNNNYFLYYEDADLCMRIKQAKYMMYYVPQAVVYHVNASSSGGAGNSLQDYYLTRNQMLFGMRHAPIRSKLALYRQSLRLYLKGRPNQKRGIQDFYFGRFGKGNNL